MENIVLHLKPERAESPPRPEKQRNLVGQAAPDIDVETWFNSPPHSAKAGGKVRILDFWGLECAPCIATMPKIAKFWDNSPQDKLEIIALTGYYHDLEIREFLAKHPAYKFSFAKSKADSTTHLDYDIRYNPTYVVISKDGKIVSYGSDWDKASAAAVTEIQKE
jgi:thiol-disulfide isomerase/thioredoxin